LNNLALLSYFERKKQQMAGTTGNLLTPGILSVTAPATSVPGVVVPTSSTGDAQMPTLEKVFTFDANAYSTIVPTNSAPAFSFGQFEPSPAPSQFGQPPSTFGPAPSPFGHFPFSRPVIQPITPACGSILNMSFVAFENVDEYISKANEITYFSPEAHKLIHLITSNMKETLLSLLIGSMHSPKNFQTIQRLIAPENKFGLIKVDIPESTDEKTGLVVEKRAVHITIRNIKYYWDLFAVNFVDANSERIRSLGFDLVPASNKLKNMLDVYPERSHIYIDLKAFVPQLTVSKPTTATVVPRGVVRKNKRPAEESKRNTSTRVVSAKRQTGTSASPLPAGTSPKPAGTSPKQQSAAKKPKQDS
jgi:hypothetical protein